MIPVRPWAIVSWISRAIRCRSSRTPASRAWVSELGVEAGVLVQRRLEPGERLRGAPRSARSTFSPKTAPALITIVWTTMIAR